jgi:trk system potassium uptake protein TrkA
MFGKSVAETLYSLGQEVLAFDIDEKKVSSVVNNVTHAVQGNACDESTLIKLGIRNFDVVIITFDKDIQSSILVTVLCKEQGVKYICAKAQSQLHAKLLTKIGADKVIFPEKEMGIRMARSMVSENVLDYINLSPEHSLTEIRVPEEWQDKTLAEIDMRRRHGINVIAISSNGKMNISPSSDYVLRNGDLLFIVGSNSDINKISRRKFKQVYTMEIKKSLSALFLFLK